MIRYHITALQEIFDTLEVTGETPNDEEKVIHLTDSIANYSLLTGMMFHIDIVPALSEKLQATVTHMVTTEGNIYLIRITSNYQEGGMC